MALERLFRSVLFSEPSPVPGRLRRAVQRMAPFGAFFHEPTVQVYLQEPGVDTYLCVNDFFDVLVPDGTQGATVHVRLHGAAGQLLVEQSFPLQRRGSLSLSTRDLLRGVADADTIGLASLQMLPRTGHPRQQEAFRSMGGVMCQFYTYYLDEKSGSVAMIHPQTSVVPRQRRPPAPRFASCQSVQRHGVSAIRLLQANPTPVAVEATYGLVDADRPGEDRLAETRIRVAPMGAGVAEFDVGTLPAAVTRVRVVADSLPSGNAKPLLMRVYNDGRFSMSHA